MKSAARYVSWSVFALLLGICGGACGSVHDAGVTAPAARADGMEAPNSRPQTSDLAATRPELFACASHDECVAVPRGGCSNGLQEAVHRDRVDDYYTAYAAERQHGGCPLIYVNDTRLPRCTDNRCQLVYPHHRKS